MNCSFSNNSSIVYWLYLLCNICRVCFLTTSSLNCPFRPIIWILSIGMSVCHHLPNVLVDLGHNVTLTFGSSDQKRSNVKYSGVLWSWVGYIIPQIPLKSCLWQKIFCPRRLRTCDKRLIGRFLQHVHIRTQLLPVSPIKRNKCISKMRQLCKLIVKKQSPVTHKMKLFICISKRYSVCIIILIW